MARYKPQTNPDDWHSIGVRSSPYHVAGNRNAAHPVNAILNYAYATLESEIRIKAISEGYDPTIGIMHEGSDGSSKFIFDLMEPERPKIDRTVLDFVKGRVFDPADFVIRTDGFAGLIRKWRGWWFRCGNLRVRRHVRLLQPSHLRSLVSSPTCSSLLGQLFDVG
jgi:hypothetical protein